MAKMTPYTIRDFEQQFPDDAACLEWLKNYLYPDGIRCKVCDRVTKHHRVESRPSYSCDHCGHHVHPTADTIYHKSSTPLRLWFYAIYLMASTRCGISAKQLQRELGVTYKTAWRIFKQVRSMMDDYPGPLSGEVEIDETYVGGRRSGGKTGRGAPGKTPVLGIVQRKGPVVAMTIPDVRRDTVIPIIKAVVPLKSTKVYTDEFQIYENLYWSGYPHETIKHGDKKYVRGHVHTNTVEGFWMLVKTGIRGVYHKVSPKYLQSYINEYGFRYNRRHQERPMFLSLLGQVRKAAAPAGPPSGDDSPAAADSQTPAA